MLASHIKQVLELAPVGTYELVKEASLQEEFPTDSKASTLASYLTATYLEKVAGRSVATSTKETLTKAASLYGILPQAKSLADSIASANHASQMEKAASALIDLDFKYAEMENSLSRIIPDLEKAASIASELNDAGYKLTYAEQAYAGVWPLNKEASVTSLAIRGLATSGPEKAFFVKLANLIQGMDEAYITPEFSAALCSQVADLDKQAQLNAKGFNPYKDFFTKQASLTVSLAGKQIPYEKIVALGAGRIGQAVGKDVAAALFKHPTEDKQILETLPLDLQQLVAALAGRV